MSSRRAGLNVRWNLVLPTVVMISATIGHPHHLAAQLPRTAFVPSVAGNGDLGSWPDAGTSVGVAAADAICESRASAAGWANPANFVAWLSTSTDDAYCRIHNLSGKKATNCGQAELPASAGPWVRADGLPFAASIDRLLSPESIVYYPLEVDEFGSVLEPSSLSVLTMTTGTGELNSASTCDDWTTASTASTRGGVGYYGSSGWTIALSSTQCGFDSRIYCLETVAGPPLPPSMAIGAPAFVTSVIGTGDLGSWGDAGGEIGIDAGDAICRARALAGGLEHSDSFKAWLADSTTDAVDRFTDRGPRARIDGVQIAESIDDLTDGKLRATLNVDEFGNYLTNTAAWTGTDSAGLALPDHCADWTTSSDISQGRAGSVWNSTGNWTSGFTFDCDGFDHLYCLADPPPVFVDGFESGDTTAWTETAP